MGANAIGNLLYQRLIFAQLCREHGLANCSLDFFFVVTNDAAVALYYCLYHEGICVFSLVMQN